MKKIKMALAFSIGIMALSQITLGDSRFQASLNFLTGFPQNDFKQNVDRTFLGLSGEFLYRFPKSIFSIGLGLEYLNYGSESRREPFGPTIPDVVVDVTTRNSIFSSAAFLRLAPIKGSVLPYAEALIGFNYLFTYTAVSDDSWSSEDIATTTNFDDWAFSYGAGVGAVIPNLVICRKQGRPSFSIGLEIGLRYLKGGTAEYLKKGSISRESGALVFTPLRSATDQVKTHLGIVFQF